MWGVRVLRLTALKYWALPRPPLTLCVRSTSQLSGQIPIIDASDLEHRTKSITAQIGTACNALGAFYVKNHGVDSRRIVTELQCFFGSENAVKEKAKPKEGYWGYFSTGEEITLGKKDWKEGMYYCAKHDEAEHPDHLPLKSDTILTANNHWPDAGDFPNFKQIVREYQTATKKLGFQLSCCIADHLGLKKTFFIERLTNHCFQQIGMFRYPQCSVDSLSSPWGVGPHSDPGFLTIVLQDAVGNACCMYLCVCVRTQECVVCVHVCLCMRILILVRPLCCGHIIFY